MVNSLKLLYEGKAKKVFNYSQSKVVIYFKDEVTALNGLKKDKIAGKGSLNKTTSSFFFRLLEKNNIETHWISDIDTNSFLAKKITIIPLEVVVRNYAAGSFCKRYGIDKGLEFSEPIVEFFLKDDDLNDPLITVDSAIAIGAISKNEADLLRIKALKINRILREFLYLKGILLVDFKLEFGKFKNRIILGDEISSDTCRFWDKDTKDSLDKDVYRNDAGDLIEAYNSLIKRLGIA